MARSREADLGFVEDPRAQGLRSRIIAENEPWWWRRGTSR
jgi:hypothetical protein